jgi:hypothetical protein
MNHHLGILFVQGVLGIYEDSCFASLLGLSYCMQSECGLSTALWSKYLCRIQIECLWHSGDKNQFHFKSFTSTTLPTGYPPPRAASKGKHPLEKVLMGNHHRMDILHMLLIGLMSKSLTLAEQSVHFQVSGWCLGT